MWWWTIWRRRRRRNTSQGPVQAVDWVKKDWQLKERRALLIMQWVEKGNAWRRGRGGGEGKEIQGRVGTPEKGSLSKLCELRTGWRRTGSLKSIAMGRKGKRKEEKEEEEKWHSGDHKAINTEGRCGCRTWN